MTPESYPNEPIYNRLSKEDIHNLLAEHIIREEIVFTEEEMNEVRGIEYDRQR